MGQLLLVLKMLHLHVATIVFQSEEPVLLH